MSGDVINRGILAGLLSLALVAPALPGQAGATPSASKPLSDQQVMGLVKGQVNSQRLALLVAERGISFTPTPQFLDGLRKAGAGEILIRAIRDARPAVAPSASLAVSNPLSNATAGHPASVNSAGDSAATAPAFTATPPSPLPALPVCPPVVPIDVGPAAPTMAEIQKAVQQDVAEGDAFAERQAWADAEGSYRKALKLDPGNASAHLGLGSALGAAERWDEAVAEYHQVLRMEPRNLQARQRLGSALAEKHDWDGATDAYRIALVQRPNDAGLESKLGDALYAKGSLAEAAKAYQAAAALSPGDAQVQSRLGEVLYASGDLGGAVQAYRESIKLGSDDAATHSSLGDALLAQGDRRGALEEYHRAFQLSPNNSTVGAAYAAILKTLSTPSSTAGPAKP